MGTRKARLTGCQKDSQTVMLMGYQKDFLRVSLKVTQMANRTVNHLDWRSGSPHLATHLGTPMGFRLDSQMVTLKGLQTVTLMESRTATRLERHLECLPMVIRLGFLMDSQKVIR